MIFQIYISSPDFTDLSYSVAFLTLLYDVMSIRFTNFLSFSLLRSPHPSYHSNWNTSTQVKAERSPWGPSFSSSLQCPIHSHNLSPSDNHPFEKSLYPPMLAQPLAPMLLDLVAAIYCCVHTTPKLSKLKQQIVIVTISCQSGWVSVGLS